MRMNKHVLFSTLLSVIVAGCGNDLESLTCTLPSAQDGEAIEVIIDHDNETVRFGGFEKEWDATIEDDRISFAFGGRIYTQDGERKIKHYALNFFGVDSPELVCELNN